MASIDQKQLHYGVLAALIVILGAITKMGGAQQFDGTEMSWAMAGVPFFLVGWVAVAYILTAKKKNVTVKTTIWILASLIVASAMAKKMYKMKGKSPPAILPLIFAASWMVLGWTAGREIGLVAAAAIVISMLVLLPMQRKKQVVDGPGMALFTLGWTLLMYSNATYI